MAHKDALNYWVEMNSKNPLRNVLTDTEHWHKLHSIAFNYLVSLDKKLARKPETGGWKDS